MWPNTQCAPRLVGKIKKICLLRTFWVITSIPTLDRICFQILEDNSCSCGLLLVSYLYALIQTLVNEKIFSELLSSESINNQVCLLDWALPGNLPGLLAVWLSDESEEAFSLSATSEML